MLRSNGRNNTGFETLAVEPSTVARRAGWGWRLVGGAGRSLIAIGLLVLLFVGYQLFGTNLIEARNQGALEAEFQQQLSEARPAVSPPGGLGTTALVPPPAPGDPVGRMEIPRIGVDHILVEGVSVEDLKRGPGHYPDTPLPGRSGNVGIAGHRTTYGAPFYRLDELQIGDPVVVTTAEGRFEYEVSESLVVEPERVEVLDATPDARITLTTCEPRFSARQRLIVVARLVGEPAPSSGLTAPAVTDGVVSDDPGALTPPPRVADLSGEPVPATPVIVWGVAAGAVAAAIWVLGRVWRRWPAYLLGTPIFLVVLGVFFENLSRLLPANA